jgi:hypothetical protein
MSGSFGVYRRVKAVKRLNLLCLMRAVAKRFPVPQDNFVPVAISSNGLVGFTTQIGSDGKLERDSEGFSAPLISGSGAIMPLPKRFVKLFVVLFLHYYINREGDRQVSVYGSIRRVEALASAGRELHWRHCAAASGIR